MKSRHAHWSGSTCLGWRWKFSYGTNRRNGIYQSFALHACIFLGRTKLFTISSSYFEMYPDVWLLATGEVEITGHGGVIIYGRSDATLSQAWRFESGQQRSIM
ncbi:MAG: hypothetical protein IPK61_08190 [Saprospiraceae bacterium]|nr:hypothetical protein [Saprospiraceae bacterium]